MENVDVGQFKRIGFSAIPPFAHARGFSKSIGCCEPKPTNAWHTLNQKPPSLPLTLIPGIGLAVTATAVMMLVVLVFLIRRKSRELEDSEKLDKTSSKAFPPSWPVRKFQEGMPWIFYSTFSLGIANAICQKSFNLFLLWGWDLGVAFGGDLGPSSMFRKFSYKEIKKATGSFNTIIGRGGFGTVYKAQFSDGLVAAVKRMNKVSEQGDDDFRREIEILARLHHRHLVALRGFCIANMRGSSFMFLLYEHMANGSLKDHLHDFGLAHASKDGSICFEPVNTDIRGTPVDPSISDSFDLDQLQTLVSIVRWCTQREGRARPSIKQVLRLLYESSDPMQSGLLEAIEDEEYEGNEGRGRTSKGKIHRADAIFHSGDGRYLASSSSTSRSYCSRSFLLETGSPQSPHNILSI
ncbi:putative receptor-like protein kinase [Quercus suber]|uniref:Receptor-like protein kinase n=1 Tax=Quercus suber TaxID=58331 RepID=A0AAW0KDC7_QUESU